MDRVSFQPSLLDGLSTLPARLHHDGAATSVLAAIWRQRLLVLCAVCAALALSVAALAVLKKSYVGETIVQLDLSRRDGGGSAEPAALVALDAAAVVQSEARIIRSRTIARRVVDRLGLADQAKPGWSVWSLLPAVLREAIVPGRARGGPGEDASETAVQRLIANLAVESDNRSYLVTIRAFSDRPEEAARIANTVAEQYIEWRLEASAEAANRRSAWLGQQVKEATAQLRDAEAAVAEQRDKTGLLEFRGDGERLEQAQLRDVAAQLSAATLARINEEGRLTRVRDLQRAGTVLSSVDLQTYPMVQQLLQRESAARKELDDMLSRLGPRHPGVVQAKAGLAELGQALATEVGRAVSVLEAGAETARRTERTLKERLDGLRQAMLLGRGGEVEYRDRLAAAQVVRDRLASLTRGYEQALAQRELRTIAALVIVRAEPVGVPASPKPPVVLALGLLGGLGAGAAGALVRERRDRGLGTASEVSAETQHRCLGVLPELGGHEQDRAVFDEAVRSVGAGIGLFGGARECQVTVVTSSVPDEGASTLCQALSRSLVAAGQRVLLIDGVPRRPAGRPERAPDESRSPGLDEGGTPLAVLARDMLTVVSRGSAVALAADVFGSGKFERVLEQARKHFDVILIEAPPVLLVADALVLGRMADRVVLAVRWTHTRRTLVQAALARLQENSVVVDGVALTRVDLRRPGRADLADQGAFYVRERRYYERLSGPAEAPAPDSSRAA